MSLTIGLVSPLVVVLEDRVKSRGQLTRWQHDQLVVMRLNALAQDFDPFLVRRISESLGITGLSGWHLWREVTGYATLRLCLSHLLLAVGLSAITR